MAQKKLSVENLTISFRTSAGKVQAVRDVSFDLYKGETLAIVGESGSGKSVTSRAVMGILAGNAIVEGGKILYGDKDLLKISEEEFHKLRGDKIAMVFQDPLSSLNPIMRVGHQLTEAMLLKNKAARRESRKRMNELFNSVNESMQKATGKSESEDIAKFKKFELKQCQLEKEYTAAHGYAETAEALSTHIALKIKNKKIDKTLNEEIKELIRCSKLSCSYFVVREDADELHDIVGTLQKTFKSEKFSGGMSFSFEKESGKAAKKSSTALGEFPQTVAKLEKLDEILKKALAFDVPNTFTIGYYLTFVDAKIPQMSVAKLNEMTHERTTADFMSDFMKKIEAGIKYNAGVTNEARKHAIEVLKTERAKFENTPDHTACEASKKLMTEAVIKCLDPLDVVLDSLTHTFATSIATAMDLYFGGIQKNKAEEIRYAKEKHKYDREVAAGRKPTWEVVPASYVNLERAQKYMLDTIDEMIDHYEQALAESEKADYAKKTLAVIDSLKENAAASVYRITKSAAREKAIKLMASVGIDEPRRRFRQYPFEFSGGMRQRIVIAIALTADPDVLICDEPTTALDVTIQAQILELINKLKKERNLSIIFITHDLGVVANMADRIAVMYAGKIVEYGTAQDVFYDPRHPYTWALLSSVPDLDTKEKLESIPGTPPNMIYPPKGDAFADRNKYALELDYEMQPPMFKVSDSHYAATWLLHPQAPKIDPPEIVRARIEKMKKKREDGKQ